MIFDSISNFVNYIHTHAHFAIVREYLSSHDLNALTPGKQEIAHGIYITMSEYQTKDFKDGVIECHRRYIDIQLVLSGAEKIGICHKDECKPGEYDEARDYQKLSGEVDFLTLKPGYFMVFFPDDGHMPQIAIKARSEVKKIVFKVPV